MSKLNSLLIVIISLCSFLCKAQTVLPDSIISKIADELVVKDHLQYVVNLQDSTLHVYENTIDLQKKEIAIYKLNEGNYKALVESLKSEVQSKDKEIKDIKKLTFKEKVLAFLKGVGTGIVVVVIYIVVHKA